MFDAAPPHTRRRVVAAPRRAGAGLQHSADVEICHESPRV